MANETELIQVTAERQVEIRNEFKTVRVQIENAQKANALLELDYTKPDHLKLAKSQCHKLRQINGEISRIHKRVKAGALGVCQLIDGVKNRMLAEVAKEIDVHEKPMLAIEEAKRKAEEEKQRLALEAEEAERKAERDALAKKQAELDERERLMRMEETARKARVELEERARRERAERIRRDDEARQRELAAREKVIAEAETKAKTAEQKAAEAEADAEVQAKAQAGGLSEPRELAACPKEDEAPTPEKPASTHYFKVSVKIEEGYDEVGTHLIVRKSVEIFRTHSLERAEIVVDDIREAYKTEGEN